MKFLRGFLFCLQVFLVTSIVGMMVAGMLGAAEGQGLASGGIVVGYGLMGGVLALVVSIVFIRMIAPRWIIRLNIAFGVLLSIAALALAYRLNTLQQEVPDDEMPKNEFTPTKTGIHHPWQSDEGTKGNIGLGFYTPDFYENNTIYLYQEPTRGKSLYDQPAFDSLVFVHSEMDTHEIAYAPPYLLPAHLKMDYGILLFRVKRISKAFYEIVVNENTGRTAIVDRFTGAMIHWPEFLVTLPSVEFPEGKYQAYKVKPLDHASEVKTEKIYRLMRPESVQENWLEVSLLNEKHQAEDRVWIKWRDGNSLRIKYSLLS